MTDHQRDLEAMNPPPFTPPQKREYAGGFTSGQRVQWGSDSEGIQAGVVTDDIPINGRIPVQADGSGYMAWLLPEALWLRPCFGPCDRDAGAGHPGNCQTGIFPQDAANIRAITGRHSAHDIAVAAGKRLAGQKVPMDAAWVNAVAERGIELTGEPGVFTIDLENGQRFRVSVREVRRDGQV